MKTEFERLQARLPMDMLSMKRCVSNFIKLQFNEIFYISGCLKVSFTLWFTGVFSLDQFVFTLLLL